MNRRALCGTIYRTEEAESRISSGTEAEEHAETHRYS